MDGLKIGTLWTATRPFDLERSFRECPTLVTLRRQTGYCGLLGCAKCYETLRRHSVALWIGVPISSQEQYGVSAMLNLWRYDGNVKQNLVLWLVD
ncbi:hypothetical protein AVEN_155650-1 [Araneus ventricosus]|uniref:Uncharacterized protein n=1 Tax=Araneus ventricosus TaxID=182803 RepID=A0A4Y2ICC6_ARAVE|nr:hypothetical protein AVEN_258027-1 [Araneus ventricosus]GBM75232.1 hypothetical protein AVEN_79443-1 [Araneus ventricosus]GBM75234.1 hypothetical protein AVEN_82545-1 [Araneus ventricosus]GBM75275.1 hypothetical protein AVEN_155650-1 [Araneus ventricosus]